MPPPPTHTRVASWWVGCAQQGGHAPLVLHVHLPTSALLLLLLEVVPRPELCILHVRWAPYHTCAGPRITCALAPVSRLW